MSYGKTIELYLANGSPDGIITAELSNWNGKAIKIPRSEVADCDRDDFKSAGVYFLFCKEDDGKDSVYIGEAENIKKRLVLHMNDYNKGKELYYWNTAVCFIGRDLNKALIRYLENGLFDMAKAAKRYNVLTKNTYKNTVMKESQISAMEEFIDNIKILTSALGYKVLEPAPETQDITEHLYCNGKDCCGIGFLSANGFTVLKGTKVSEIANDSLETYHKSYYKLRTTLENDGTIVDGVFTVNYEFNSPSAASTIIKGYNTNGTKEWKTDSGVTLKDL